MDVDHPLDAQTLLELVDAVRDEVEAILKFRPDDMIFAIDINVEKLHGTVRVRRPD